MRILQNVSNFFQFFRFSWIFLNSSKFLKIPQVVTSSLRFVQILFESSSFSQILSESLRFLQILLGFPRFSRFSHILVDSPRDLHIFYLSNHLRSFQIFPRRFRFLQTGSDSSRFPQIPPDSFKFFQFLYDSSCWIAILKILLNFSVLLRLFEILTNFLRSLQTLPNSSRFF